MPYIKKVLGISLVSLLIYSIWVAYSGFDEVYAGLQRVGFLGFFILLLLSLVNYALRFYRWHWMILSVTGVAVPLKEHCYCYLAGFALTATPGKVGEALRSYYMKPHGIKVPDSLAALFAERLIDLISVLLIGGLALVQFREYRWVGVLVVILVILAGMFVRLPLVPKILNRLAENTPSEKVRTSLHGLVSTMNSARSYLAWKIWLPGVLMGVVAWGAEAWGFVLLVKWLTGVDWGLIAAGIYALSMIVGAVSFLPGGLGGAEAVMAGALLALGVNMADATVATIICRVVTLWFAIFIGLIVMARMQAVTRVKQINLD